MILPNQTLILFVVLFFTTVAKNKNYSASAMIHEDHGDDLTAIAEDSSLDRDIIRLESGGSYSEYGVVGDVRELNATTMRFSEYKEEEEAQNWGSTRGPGTPSASPRPTPSPTSSPTPYCKDSTSLFGWNGKVRKCMWVAKRMSMCRNEDIKHFCPQTCGSCEYACDDVEIPFHIGKFKKKSWTCEEVGNLPIRTKEAKCLRSKFYTSCRETCEVCGHGETILVDFDENGDQTAEYYRDDIMLDNFWSLRGETAHPGSGYQYGTKSQPLVGFNGFANSMTMSCPGGKFSLNSVWMTPAWDNYLQVTIDGYENGSLKATFTDVLPDTTQATFFESQLNGFKDLDSLTISTDPSHVVIDDMTIEIHSPCTVLPRVVSTRDTNAAILRPFF